MTQVVQLHGVLDDGTRVDPRIEADTATSIRLPQGADSRIRVDVYTNAGIPDPPQVGDVYTLTIARRLPPNCEHPVLSVVGTFPASPATPLNRIEFAVSATATRFFYSGRYWFDVWLTRAGTRNQLIAASILVLQPSVNVTF